MAAAANELLVTSATFAALSRQTAALVEFSLQQNQEHSKQTAAAI